MSNEHLIFEARLQSTKMVQEIVEVANKKPGNETGMYGALTAGLVFQTMTTYTVSNKHKPGSDSGKELIKKFYAEALKDALERWDKDDIKGLGPKG